MRTKALLVLALLSVFSYTATAQTAEAKTAKKQEVVKKTTTKKATAQPEVVLPKTVDLDRESTYERIIDKGYESVDMLKKVADKRFFNNEFQLAARWYGCLFDLTTDLEPVYYYRYATALKETNQHDKAQAMMELFKQKKKGE